MPIKILPHIITTQPFEPNKPKPFRSQIEKPKPEIKRGLPRLFFIQ